METNKIYTLEFSYPQNPQKNGKHRIEVTHDEHKRTPMRTEIHSDWLEDDTWQFGGKTEITYNEDNQPLTIHHFAPKDEEWQSVGTIEYQYDKRGRKIEELQLDGDNTPEKRLVYDYHFDNEGNGHVIISEEEWHCNSWRKVSEYTEQHVEQKIVSRIQHSRRQPSGIFTPEWNDEYTTHSYEIASGLYQETVITSRLGLTQDKTELGDWEEKMKTFFEKHGSNETRTQYSKQGKEWVARKKQELTKSNNIIIAQKDYVYKGGEWILEYEEE